MSDLFDGRDDLAPKPARLRARDLYELDELRDGGLADVELPFDEASFE